VTESKTREIDREREIERERERKREGERVYGEMGVHNGGESSD
jgi:hypothetical protein